MRREIKIPEVGESVQEAVLAQWYKRDGDLVRKDEILFVIETDKVTLEVNADADGVLHILVPEGQTVAVGTVVASIDTDADARAAAAPPKETPPKEPQPVEESRPMPYDKGKILKRPMAEIAPKAIRVEEPGEAPGLGPSVRQLLQEKGVDSADIVGTGPGGRITRGDVLLHLEESGGRPEEQREEVSAKAVPKPSEKPAAPASRVSPAEAPSPGEAATGGDEPVSRRPMSRIRQRIAERLLEARQNTAMLTTFNEIDMSRVQGMRARFKEAFQKRHGIGLGLMSFFVKASVAALQDFPQVNAFIEGKEIVSHHYYHIGVAVGAERGLVVPVIRHADRLGFASIERSIADYVEKIRENRLELADLEGGTFTISNGGIYGSLLSTPILNTPQSGILGLHKIEDRPVVVDGQIVIRPMMYVALSYDHRIVDGREAVSFLKRIKECLEAPERLLIEI